MVKQALMFLEKPFMFPLIFNPRPCRDGKKKNDKEKYQCPSNIVFCTIPYITTHTVLQKKRPSQGPFRLFDFHLETNLVFDRSPESVPYFDTV
jgi:hypothetical protein